MNQGRRKEMTVRGERLPERSFLDRQRMEATETPEDQPVTMNRAQRRAYFKKVKRDAKKRGAW